MHKNSILKMLNGFGKQKIIYTSAYAFSNKFEHNLLIGDQTSIKADLKVFL